MEDPLHRSEGKNRGADRISVGGPVGQNAAARYGESASGKPADRPTVSVERQRIDRLDANKSLSPTEVRRLDLHVISRSGKVEVARGIRVIQAVRGRPIRADACRSRICGEIKARTVRDGLSWQDAAGRSGSRRVNYAVRCSSKRGARSRHIIQSIACRSLHERSE